MIPCQLDNQRILPDIDNLPSEYVRQCDNTLTLLRTDSYLHQHKFPCHGIVRIQHLQIDDVDQLPELLGDLLKDIIIPLGHNCNS